MSRASAAALAALLFFGILTVWIPYRWAVYALEAGLFALAIPWAAAIALRRRSPRGSILIIPLLAAVLWGLLQLLCGWTVYRFETWNAVLTWSAHLAVFCLALQIFAPAPNAASPRAGFRRALLYFGFALSVLSVVQYFTSPGKIFGIFPVDYANVGPFLNRDHYATFIELILPLALFEAIRDRRKTLSHAVMAGVMFASVIAGASRAGSILVTLEILVVLFLAFSPRFASAATAPRALLKIVFFAVVLVAIVGWEVLWNRFQEPDPFRGRRELLQSSIAMVRERPWTGFGLGTWPTAYPAYALFDRGMFANHAHNDWAEWAAEGGLPFLLMLLAVAAGSVRLAIRSPWGLGVVAAFCHCAVDFPMQRLAISALLFALLGVMAAAAPRRP